MSTALATKETTEVAQSSDDPFVQMVERFATNPDIDADKLQKLVDMQMQILDRNAKTEFYDAMNRVQAELPTIINDAMNKQTGSWYAKLETINQKIKPIYTREGFSTSFWQGKAEQEGYVRVEGRLRHRTGHCEEGFVTEVPPDKTGIKGNVNKTDIHAAGSAFKYGRRYLTCLMFDVSTGDKDDDGNAASYERISEEQLAKLEELITDVGADLPKFLSYCNIERLSDLPAKSYAKAVKALEKKRKG